MRIILQVMVMQQYRGASFELTKAIKNIMEKTESKWYAAKALPDENKKYMGETPQKPFVLHYDFLNPEILKNPELLSASMGHTLDLLCSFERPAYSSRLIATQEAFFSNINHCFVPHHGIIVEFEKEDGIPEYLNALLDELDIKVTRIEKGQITFDSGDKYGKRAYYITPLKN